VEGSRDRQRLPKNPSKAKQINKRGRDKPRRMEKFKLLKPNSRSKSYSSWDEFFVFLQARKEDEEKLQTS
jgi:hypothetical protein